MGAVPAAASSRRIPGHGQMEEQQRRQQDDQAGKNHQQDYDQRSLDICPFPHPAPASSGSPCRSKLSNCHCPEQHGRASLGTGRYSLVSVIRKESRSAIASVCSSPCAANSSSTCSTPASNDATLISRHCGANGCSSCPAVQQRHGTPFVATSQMIEADCDLKQPLIKRAQGDGLDAPQFLEGFVAGEEGAGIELADSRQQRRRCRL